MPNIPQGGSVGLKRVLPRILITSVAVALLAYAGVHIFRTQPIVGTVVISGLAMISARWIQMPGAALTVGTAAAIWNGVIELPHAWAGFLGTAVIIEVWAIHIRQKHGLPPSYRLASSLALTGIILGSPVAIGFAAGPGYNQMANLPEHRHYIVDLSAIGLTYLAIISAGTVLIASRLRHRHAQNRGRRTQTKRLLEHDVLR